MSSEKYIGLDVHQATISVAVLDSRGKLVMESIVETKAATILDFFAGLRGTLSVTFEEGTWAAWLYDLLKPHVDKLVVCNPRKNALLKDGNKSDRIDARKLAVLVLRTVAAAVDGRVPGNCSCRWKLCQDCAWWLRGGADAISEQRNLPRRRGCRHRHAAALGVKHHQSCARSLPDFWFGPFSASGSDRRSIGDVHGTQHRGHLSVLSPASWQRADSRAAAAHPAELCRSTAAPASLVDWHPAICHRAH